MQAKWIETFFDLLKGKEAHCPNCKSANLEYGYVLFEKNKTAGYGAVWCKDCNHALNLSRANVKNEDKVLPELPSNLIFS